MAKRTSFSCVTSVLLLRCASLVNATKLNPRTYTQIHTPTVVQRLGAGAGAVFDMFDMFRNDFTFSGKPLIFLTR